MCLTIFQSTKNPNRQVSVTLEPLSSENRLKTDLPPDREAWKNRPVCILLMLLLWISDSEKRRKGLRVLHKGILTWHMGSNCDLWVTRRSAGCWRQVSPYLGLGFMFFEVWPSLPLTNDVNEADSGEEHDWRVSVEIWSHFSTCSVKQPMRWSLDVKLVFLNRPSSHLRGRKSS